MNTVHRLNAEIAPDNARSARDAGVAAVSFPAASANDRAAVLAARAHAVAAQVAAANADRSNEWAVAVAQHAAAAHGWVAYLGSGDPDGAPGYAATLSAAAWSAHALALAADDELDQ